MSLSCLRSTLMHVNEKRSRSWTKSKLECVSSIKLIGLTPTKFGTGCVRQGRAVRKASGRN